MFSDAEHCICAKNQILETVCQIRFPTILNIDTTVPAEFQESIRDTFPRYECRKEQPFVPPAAAGAPPRPAPAPITNYSFSTADGKWRINLTQNFIALTTSAYTCWEDFAKLLDKPLVQLIRIYKPAFFERIGLRYINAFSRRELSLEGTPWRALIADEYLGALADETVDETRFTRCSQDLEMTLEGGCRLKLHAGPGLVRRGGDDSDKEVKYVLDSDISMAGNLPVNMVATFLSALHLHAYSTFRGAITEELHAAMHPCNF